MRSTAELRDWLRSELPLDPEKEATLISAIDQLIAWQRQLLEASKREAIEALSAGFAEKLAAVQRQLTEKDATVSTIARYFEELVATLSERAQRDPKTKLLNFHWFMERLQIFLGVEQRVRWCGVGVVDIRGFKSYNDSLGHATGDRIIERVAAILSEQIRSEDLLAVEREGARDLHARFGGDEFCFLIPDLPGFEEAVKIAGRFKGAVEGHDWLVEDPRLAGRPVQVDVGIVCLRLGPVGERRGMAGRLAAELIERADRLMYDAKEEQASHVHARAVRVSNGQLVEVYEAEPTRLYSGEPPRVPQVAKRADD